MDLTKAIPPQSQASLCWPSEELVRELEVTQLLRTWLARRIEASVRGDQSIEGWQEQQFAEAARQLFLEMGSRLDEVCLSLLQSHNVHLAQEWYFKLLDEDADFRSLALQSPGINRKRAGTLGPIRVEELHAPIDRLVLRANPGVVQPPLLMPNGLSILVRLDLRQPAQWDDATRKELIQRLYRRWLDEAINTLLEREPVSGEFCSILLP